MEGFPSLVRYAFSISGLVVKDRDLLVPKPSARELPAPIPCWSFRPQTRKTVASPPERLVSDWLTQAKPAVGLRGHGHLTLGSMSRNQNFRYKSATLADPIVGHQRGLPANAGIIADLQPEVLVQYATSGIDVADGHFRTRTHLFAE